jgi:manganese/zinc-transporting P-type ATPase C
MFKRKEKSLIGYEVRHAMPGRLRLGCEALRYLEPHRMEIEDEFSDVSGVDSVKVSIHTGNVLVLYDTQVLNDEDIREIAERILGGYTLVALKAQRAALSQPTVMERRLQEEPITEMVNRVAVTTTTLLMAWFRRHGVKQPRGLVKRMLSMPALTALYLSKPIMSSGWESLKTSKRPNADTLSATAILSSLIAGQDVSALTIIWLADLAELLTAYTMDRTRNAIHDMLSVGDEFAWLLQADGSERKVLLNEVQESDTVVVHTGEKICADGVVENGQAVVDQASVTGEFMPVTRQRGAEVFAGTVVKSGTLQIQAQRVGDDTAVARIVHMVEDAIHHKANVQNFADRFSAAFIPVNFALSGLVYGITRQVSRALNMLIIDYSCGVRLSTATALSAAICTAAKNGILIKGGNYLELMEDCDTMILDKTGTLTQGRPAIVSTIPVDKKSTGRRLLELAAAAEESSGHPMAVAILDMVRRNGWSIPLHTPGQTHIARGVETVVNRQVIRVGSRRYMEENNIPTIQADSHTQKMMRRRESVLYVSAGRELVGVLGIQDPLRENMKKSLNRLRQSGMDEIILLTGDVEQHAEIIAGHMAVDRFKAEALPEDKAEMILKLQSKGAKVVMVGDGINDAPALAYANVGMAMGATRTDVAMEAADITIAGDNPLMIPGAMRLSQKTMQIIRQNFGLSVGVNTLGLALSSLGVLPVFWGAVLHNACTVAVVMNSGRLLFHDLEQRR